MIAWILARAKERTHWMSQFLLAGAAGWAVTPDHKVLIINAAVAIVAAGAAFTRDKPAAE